MQSIKQSKQAATQRDSQQANSLTAQQATIKQQTFKPTFPGGWRQGALAH